MCKVICKNGNWRGVIRKSDKQLNIPERGRQKAQNPSERGEGHAAGQGVIGWLDRGHPSPRDATDE